MNEFEDISIASEEEYNRAIGIMKAIDDEVNFFYSELEKVTDEVQIVEIQRYINALNIRRLGLFKLVAYYEDNASDSKKELPIYYVRMGDTLPLIAQAFYGRSEFSEYLYYHNNLETINLSVNQAIEIPEIHPDNPDVFAQYQIDNLDAINVSRGII